MPEFDRFSGDYAQILDRSTAMFGDGPEYFAEHKARYLATLVTGGFGGKILDFGCGVGLLSRFIAIHMPSAALHGFDVSSASIDAMDPRLRNRGRFTSCFDDLDTDYAVIVVSNVMHHIRPDERQRTVSQLATRIAAGGRLVVFEHNPLNPLTRWVVSHCLFDEDAILLPRRETVRYMKNAGLPVSRRDFVLFLPRILSWMRPLERRLAWCPLGAQYVVVAEKQRVDE